jgi:hypothetical protein
MHTAMTISGSDQRNPRSTTHAAAAIPALRLLISP